MKWGGLGAAWHRGEPLVLENKIMESKPLEKPTQTQHLKSAVFLS